MLPNLEHIKASAHLQLCSLLALAMIKAVRSAVASVYIQICLDTTLLYLSSMDGILFTRTVP